MNTFQMFKDRSFEEFEYQLVYIRPSPHLDERIAVGVVASAPRKLELRLVSSVASLHAMSQVLGGEGVEQFQFAAAELRRTLTRAAGLDSLRLPTDLFVLGERQSAFTSDRAGLLSSILASSCLVRNGPSRRIEAESSPASDVSKDIASHVSRLNPLIAEQIFNRKVRVETDEMKLPIFGRKIFGAPVSFASRDQSLQTEAYIAKFRWLRQSLQREPRIYVLHPESSSVEDGNNRLRKLEAIARASDVALKISASAEEIAAQIVREEAA